MAPKRKAPGQSVTVVAVPAPDGDYGRMVANERAKGDTINAIQQDQTDPVWTWAGQEQEYRVIGLVLMPEEFPELLYADSFASDKTCCKSLLQSQALNFVTPAPPETAWMKPDESIVISKRGNGAPWLRMLVDMKNPTQAKVGYRLKNTKNRSITSVPSSSDYLKLQPGGRYFDYNIADCDPDTGGTQLAKSWNTATMVCGRSLQTNADARWVLLNAVRAAPVGKVSNFTITYEPTTALAKDCVIRVIAWNGDEPLVVGGATFAAGAAPVAPVTINITGDNGVPDFYTFDYAITDAGEDTNFDGLGGFMIEGASYCEGLAQVPTDSAFQNIFQLGKMTTIAASTRVTNMAPPLAIQGEALFAHTRDKSLWWLWYLNGANGTGSVLDVAASYKDRYLGQGKNGLYGWHMPFRKTQFELQDCCELDYDKNIIKDIWWDIEDDSDVNVFIVRSQNNGNTAGSTGQGCDFWITCVTCFNWVTDNKWPTGVIAPYSYTIWATALDNLRFVPRGMSNKFHMPELLGWLTGPKAQKWAHKYVKPMLYHGGRAVAEKFLGTDLTDRGIKALTEAYGLGNEIVSRLQGGGK